MPQKSSYSLASMVALRLSQTATSAQGCLIAGSKCTFRNGVRVHLPFYLVPTATIEKQVLLTQKVYCGLQYRLPLSFLEVISGTPTELRKSGDVPTLRWSLALHFSRLGAYLTTSMDREETATGEFF